MTSKGRKTKTPLSSSPLKSLSVCLSFYFRPVMAMNEDFERDPLSGGSFSQLLGSNDDVMGFDMTESLFYPSSSFSFPPGNSPTMLCFETSRKESPVVNKQKQENNKINSGGDQTCSASSSNNSSSSGSGVVTVTTTTKSKKSQSEEENTEQERRHTGAHIPGTKRETKKKQKTDTLPTPTQTPTSTLTSTRPAKVRRKEKLGERVTALQQLVSPFGKTDTASVLHEAMGYIRFLHDQVQVLSSPYLQIMPSHQDGRGIRENGKELKYDLRSRGLGLVPVEYTQQVASSNGADFWSPAMGSNNNNSSQ